MSTVRGSVKIRDAEAVTSGALVTIFNTVDDLIARSGMIQVANDEYLGQSKLYSTTAGAGLTQVTAAGGSFSATVVGYKVYRHPALGFYIKVDHGYVVQASGPIVFPRIQYQLCTELNGTGGFVAAKATGNIIPVALGVNSAAMAGNSNDYVAESLTVSCGDSYFWISRNGGIHTTKINTTAALPPKLDWLGIGVFASQLDNSILCCVVPQEISTTSTGGLLGKDLTGYSQKACLRYLVYSDNYWSWQKNGAAGSLSNASYASTSDGIRVTQSELVVNGLYHRFNFGFVNAAVLGYSDIVDINLTGVIGKYQPLPSMGYADHAANTSLASDNSIVVFPVSS